MPFEFFQKQWDYVLFLQGLVFILIGAGARLLNWEK